MTARIPTERIPTPRERALLAEHVTLLAVGAGIDTVATLALHLDVSERTARRYLEALTESQHLVMTKRLPQVWRLAPLAES
jgi:response regulator of citrate/malate metabolism